MTTYVISNAIKAILADTDIHRAIVEYIQTATNAIKPKDEWREVYYRGSDSPRIFVIPENPYTGVKNQRSEVYLHLTVLVHDQQRVAKISAFMLSIKHRTEMSYRFIDAGLGNPSPVHELVLSVKDYSQAIDSGIALWDDLVLKFEGMTEPIDTIMDTLSDHA